MSMNHLVVIACFSKWKQILKYDVYNLAVARGVSFFWRRAGSMGESGKKGVIV